MVIASNILFFVIAVFAAAFGFFLYFSPCQAFEIQKKFYALINWRIEPISLEKEIRNTKCMGIFLFVFIFFACLYRFFK